MEWINVYDEEPSLYDCVLVTDGEFVDIGAMQSDGSFCGCDMLDENVTHWMPLPEPPKEVK